MTSFSTLARRPEYSPLSLARMLWKCKIFAVAVWAALCVVSAVVVFLIPASYRSEALILVDSQKIPEKYVTATVNADVQDRLATINQRILSATQLKKIIDDFQLYPDERKHEVEEDVLDRMRRDIEVKLERGWTGNRPGAFRIAYLAPAPTLAADVANRLSNLYIEENLRTREVQAEGTSEFLDAQLQEAKQGLETLEKAVSDYKMRHTGELPEQEGTISGMLSRLHTALQGVQDAMNRAEQNRILQENTLAMAQAAETALRARTNAKTDAPEGAGAPSVPGMPAPKRSELIEKQLEALRTRYSDDYPDMKRLAAELEIIRRQERQDEARSRSQTPGSTPKEGVAAAVPDSPELIQARERTESVRAQLKLVEKELASRAAERKEILAQIAAAQARLQQLPVREQEMASLTRDYEMSKANYRSLLEKKLSAEMATEMERRQKAERFTVLDPARVPEKPYRPDRPLLGGISCGLGLAIAIGLAIAKELRKGVVLGEWELPEKAPILGRVPPFALAPKKAGRLKFWKRRGAAACAVEGGV